MIGGHGIGRTKRCALVVRTTYDFVRDPKWSDIGPVSIGETISDAASGNGFPGGFSRRKAGPGAGATALMVY